jgi:sodium transport system ATP-binding protein
MIEIRDLTKSYGRTSAVESVSFAALNGVVTGLLGPNGAGKTTTLRAVGGLIRPDAGAALVDGEDVQHDPRSARTRFGMLPEVVGLYDHLTVREHLAYAGKLHRLAPPALAARVNLLLDQFALAPLADRRAATLSFGQRRRVALARALVHDPMNVILDEPTNGLDVLSAREVRREIRRLAATGRAVILSSHVMPEVSAVCDRIVLLSRGRVVATGTPHEIVARTGRETLEEAFVELIGSEEASNQESWDQWHSRRL